MHKPTVHILLIEDNEADALYLQEMLSSAANPAFVDPHVTRLSAGLEALADGPVDTVLLDLGLPDSQGMADAA